MRAGREAEAGRGAGRAELGQAGGEVGRAERSRPGWSGPGRVWAVRREGWGWAGWLGLGWVKGLGPLSFSILFQHTQTKLNSNLNLNSTLARNQIKEMLQHDATTKKLNL